MNINKVSQSLLSQTPEFVQSEYPIFAKFLEYYYKSQEKTGLGQNIVNNFLSYLDIDRLNVDILDGATKLIEPINSTSTEIVVESVDQFLEKNGSILIGDEVIYYESLTRSPNIAFSPGIAYEQVKLKWTTLASIVDSFDGTTRSFPLISQESPIGPPSPQHLIVRLYGEVLVPVIDYTIQGTNIVFETAPRARQAEDDVSTTYITYLNGFIENPIVLVDNISSAFGEQKDTFSLTKTGVSYEPIADEYVIAIYDGVLLTPKVDYYVDKDKFIFQTAPIIGRQLTLYSIEAPIPSFGDGAVGYAQINDSGELTSISSAETGSGYRFEYPPKISINSDEGLGASASALVNGVKTITLIDGGSGYSDTNPPTVIIENPTRTDSQIASIKATVTNGSVTALTLENSGSGYTFTPRVTFKQPGGAKIATPQILNGSLVGPLEITDNGFGYTTPPVIYVDEPTGANGIKASLLAVLSPEGELASITIMNPGQGYENPPRIAVVDPVGAQVLQTFVDGTGRVTNIELLDGGVGYEEIPSVYVVDPRTSGGGTGATAAASVFNGRITDINITNFGSGYSADFPPNIVIQAPPQARASVEVGQNEVTGFNVNKPGSGYSKSAFIGCARGVSGITGYDSIGNAEFHNDTTPQSAENGAAVKCLDAAFIKRVLDKYTEQFLPDVPELDYKKIDVRTAIKTIKDFYTSKGTTFSIAYLFKLLYGESVNITYPKDQIIKPSSATWSIDTILRATLVSGDPANIKDSLLVQEADIADPNVQDASALVENYISIKTSETEIFELVLSEETISGRFTVPYKTRLAEPLNATDSIITVDSTIGWPERNGQFIIGGSEVVEYKEKSLNQFIECTRSVNSVVEDWDSATEVSSNFRVFLNKGTAQEVVMNIVGIVDAQQTTLTDTGSYYLPGDKLSVSKLGGTSTIPQLTTWLYNVKKLVEVSTVTFGGVNNQSATVTCSAPHGLLVGDQVTVYGANPILYNGTFLVTSRDSQTVFQYQLPQPASVVPQGNILISVDLNKGKSITQAIQNAIGPYTTNVQNSFFNDNYVYIASTGIPNYEIGPFIGSALLPGNQRKLNRFNRNPLTISTKTDIVPGPIGTWVNGVSVWSYKSELKSTFGAVTSINILNAGKDYDAASPPVITISGGFGSGATADVVVDGSMYEIEVNEGGSGYTSSPLVSIVGGGGSGASATAIITKGRVSRILVNEGGSGYTSQPSITIVGGGGTGATATAYVRGPIKEVNITNGGASYTKKPNVVLSSGKGAVAQAIVNDGRIISVAIISAGSGYTTAPEVTIQGDGFGAIAKATIDTDGENAGRVTGVEIINRGIGYLQGTTSIGLTSVGSDAQFEAEVFQWNYNLQETTSLDSAKGAIFEGYNVQYGGEYAHLSNPQRLRYILGDSLFQNSLGQIKEQEEQLEHSPIIGWAFDGNPIYGPYGYSDPTNQSSSIKRMGSSYSLKSGLVYNDVTNPYPVRTAGPSLNDEPAGNFVEDYEYVFGSGDLDQYNGRFCKTPEYSNGRYCYFVTIDATEDGNPVFPYILGPQYNSVVDKWNLVDQAVQQNIPEGVVRYRDPYENVDIDVERVPNASTNSLTTEGGDILLFEIEDENRDGFISQAETDDPDELLEESPLQLFDYFPKVKFDSKVDIEVETISKFEDASVTGFTIENAGTNYQVNDRLIFDNTDTDGTGASARISRIKGETVISYNYETVEGTNFGVLQTRDPHNIVAGDQIFVDYTPVMDNTNKTFVVRQYKGIEEIVVTQNGSGYNTDIPPTITIDGDGVDGRVESVVDAVGAIKSFNILNSGSGYTQNPRVILSHPQVFKKSDYYDLILDNNDWANIIDIQVTENKEAYICGSTEDDIGNKVGFLAKISATGVLEWQKTLETLVPASGTYTEFQRIIVDGNDIWVLGINKPNITVLEAYNPDIILAKYVQNVNGLDATLDFQKAYAGISGSTRSDNVTAFKKLTDSRFVFGGFTDTNSGAPWDAFLAVIDTSGFFVAKRKLASDTSSEKVTDIQIVNGDIYFSLEISDSKTSNNINAGFGKVTPGISTLTVNWIKEISNTTYSFLNSSLSVDEFNEFYIPCTLRAKANHTTKDSFWVGKFDINGNTVWNNRYLAAPGETGYSVDLLNRSTIDIFGDLNIGLNKTDSNGRKSLQAIKIKYNGDGVHNSTIHSEPNAQSSTTTKIEGFTMETIFTDVSGDAYFFGQSNWNRNELICKFDSDATDLTAHHTVEVVGASGGHEFADGTLKLYGYETGAQSTWSNSYLKVPAASLADTLNGDWTLQFFVYKEAANSQTLSQGVQTLVGIGGAQDATGGLWLGYDTGNTGKLQMVISNNSTQLDAAGSGLSSTLTTMYADNTWQVISLTKQGTLFKAFVNGIEVLTGNVTDTALGNKDLYIGNQVGWGTNPTDFVSGYQGQFYVDCLTLKNRMVTPTVPNDFTVLPTTGAFGFAFDWVDDAWFTTATTRYDYIPYDGIGLKMDRGLTVTVPSAKLTNTKISLRSNKFVNPPSGTALTISNVGYGLGGDGFQSLDFNDVNSTMSQNTETIAISQDIWGSRTATVPSPGSQKVQATAVVKDRYFFKVTDTTKIDNVQRLTINQPFNFTVNSKLKLMNGSQFVNSGYIIDVDTTNRYVYLAINNNSWSNDLNTGHLATERFDEQTTFGIRGPVVNDVNEIEGYSFANIVNTTPGTFDIDMSNFDAPPIVGGTNNLHEYSYFKPYSGNESDYTVRIDEASGGSPYIVGSVVNLNDATVTYNSDYNTINIQGLTGVLKITLITNLNKILQATAVTNSDLVYVISSRSHYLSDGEIVYIDGNPTPEVDGTVYDEYNGAFPVEQVISVKEFTYRINTTGTPAVTTPATTGADVDIFVKSPTLKMYYGHQYIFDLSHSSLVGGNLSFSKDSLNKLEYSFNSIERIGTPGVTGGSAQTPSVKLKVDRDIVTNISYYFDPSRTGADSPVIAGSYLDVVASPYEGNFTLTGTSGETITRGADTFRFPLVNEPEGAADVQNVNYSTSSEKAVGSIADVRIVNKGGFYTRLPVISGIQSNRKIERVQINEPGTEYAPGQYNNVPIQGDGEGGLVNITVEDTQDAEGTTIPGQITSAIVSSPGKGYTTATIDIAGINGILGPSLSGSGADLEVVIPPFGTGASVFTKGTEVGKIKKLKNNNFGYDYPHDYTLRPEITFPLNCQLTSTSILDSITVTNPGSGYSQAPAVIISGGGGSGATAESTISNGRLDQIIVKDPGAGYSSTPTVSLKSSFNYVVNLDLGLLQFAFPHGILNGAEVTLNVTDTGDGAEFPLSSGAIGRLNANTTYYAIAGSAQSLDDDQLRLAITAANAELGDALTFVNAGTGRQQVLTESFGGAAEANVITSTFLEGELIYQGLSIETATATGYVSTNNGWQVGPRVLKIVDYDGDFVEGERITGIISKSSGLISDLKVAKGVLEIGSITKTTGQFIDDVGKPSEIIQKIQDSYFYQDFSYAVKSSVSVSEWKDILIRNVHPAGFKVFGELNLDDYATIPNKETSFELTKSVQLAQEAVVPNIQSFALVEPIYQEFNNTEVLFRQKRLTSSENILTSVVQRLDNISNLFDGVRIAFPLSVNGETVVAAANQLMIVMNGVVQTPEVAFKIEGDSIVFAEPPAPPASVKYAEITIEQIPQTDFTFTNQSGIFPNTGNIFVGTASQARMTVTSVTGNTVRGFMTEGTFQAGELITGNTTGFSGNLDTETAVVNDGLFLFNEQVTNFDGATAKVEQINLEAGTENALATLRFGIGTSTSEFEILGDIANFAVNDNIQISAEIMTITDVQAGTDEGVVVLDVTRAQLGTTAIAHLQSAPLYSTEITITNELILSKTAGTYQSTPGLFDIALNDIIIAAGSGVVARVTATSAYQDPATQQFISQVNISEGSSFFGLLFNRIQSVNYQNIVLDDIAASQISIVDFEDNATAFDSNFPANELVNNIVIDVVNVNGTFQEGEMIRNKKIEVNNPIGDFISDESAIVRKLTHTDTLGKGFFSPGQVIRNTNSKAEVVAYNQARKTVYLGRVGRSKSTGQDYHEFTFNAGAELNTYNKKFGLSALALSKGTSPHTFVSGVTEGITANNSALFTAATGTTYNPLTGEMVIEIGTHTLDTSNTILIAENALTFRCESDNNTNPYTYPRTTDPAYNNNLAITAFTATTITVNVGAIPRDEFLSVPTSTEFGFGSGNFTVECWIKPNHVIAGSKAIFDFRSAASELAPYLYLDGANIKYYNNGSIVIAGTQNLVAGTWYHVALTRNGSSTRLFINGAQDGSTYSDGSNYGTTKPIRIGGDYAGSNCFAGYLDEFRVSTSSRYTAAFTAPTGVFQGDADTVLLIHFDGANGDTYTDDWSGTATWTRHDDFGNDAIRTTQRTYTAAPAGYVGKTHRYADAARLLENNKDLIASEAVYLMRQRYPELVIPGQRFSPTSGTYDPLTGLLTMGVTQNNLESGGQITPASATYDPATGVIQITKRGHGVTNGKRVNIKVGGLTFNCTQNSNATDHSYPRSTDPAAGRWLIVSNATTDTFEVNVGASGPSDQYAHTFVSALENCITVEKDRIKINRDAFTFTCSSDNFQTEVTYPRLTDPATKDNALPIINSTTTSITVNVGTSPFIYYTPTNATYNPADGEFVMTIANHNINVGTKLRLANESFTFTCDQDNDGSNHSYPRSTAGDGQPDPAYNKTIEVTAVGTSTANITNAGYVASTGILTITSATHGLSTGNMVQIATDSLTFTCSDDGNTAQKTYPRISDPISGLWVPVTVVDANTFTIDVGQSPPASQYTHTFVSATANALIKQTGTVTVNVGASAADNQYAHTFVSAASNAVITGGTYIHRFVSATANSVVADQKVNCEDDVKDLTQALINDLRSGSNNHIWDASALYVDRESNPVGLNHVETEIDQTLWILDRHVEFCNDIINNELITISGDHGFTQFTDTTIYDSNNYGSLTQLTPSTATYDPATGDLVLTSAGHGLTTSSRISIDFESLTFTCTDDNNNLEVSYPRDTDPAYRRVLRVTAFDTNTFTVNVGASPTNQQYPHTFVSAATNAIDVLDYTSADCADVQTTIGNLMDIVKDTLSNANLASPVDHLATITKVTPVYEWLGAYVDAYLEVPIDLTDVTVAGDVMYANLINTSSQYRFQDAANLIRLNRKAIVDKTAFDMLERYPGLTQSMPRNDGGASTAGTLRCKTDLGLILDAIASDIEFGGNFNLVEGVKTYLGQNDVILHVRLQLLQSAYAHERLAFYAKQAITGDLTTDNTDSIIIGDWGITQDPGNCANVQTAIDSLIDLANSILAPSGDRYRDAADLLHFNKNFIADEATLITDADFTYLLGPTSYRAFQYPGGQTDGRNNCMDDIKDLLNSVIADLLTGGNSNTVEAIKLYLTPGRGITQVEDQILPTIYAFQKVRMLGKKAINNLLLDRGGGPTGDQYRAVYTFETPYTDTTITDSSGDTTYDDDECADVIQAFDSLMDLVIDSLTPGGTKARSAGRMLLFNENYFATELEARVVGQWGAGAWTYDDFIAGLLDDTIHDMVTTDTSIASSARDVEITRNVVGDIVVQATDATYFDFNDRQSVDIAFSGTGGGSGGGFAIGTHLKWAGGTGAPASDYPGGAAVFTPTIYGAPAISTTTPGAGFPYSVDFPGQGGNTNADVVYFTDTTFQLSQNATTPAGDFTISFFVYFDRTDAQVAVNAHETLADIGGLEIRRDQNRIVILAPDASGIEQSPLEIATSQYGNGQWHHIAITNQASTNTTKLYLDGVLKDTEVSTSWPVVSGLNWYIGGDYTQPFQRPFNGKMSEFMVSDILRYTANFTVPTAAATADPDTTLLCLQASTFVGYGPDISGQPRYITTQAINTTNYDSIVFSVIRGNDNNGGEQPGEGQANEHLYLSYSTNNKSTWTSLGILVNQDDSSFDVLKQKRVGLPAAARGASVHFKIHQDNHSGVSYDDWGVTRFVLEADPVYANDEVFVVGETVTSSGGGKATILEYYNETNILVIGPITGSTFADGETLTQGNNTGTIITNGVSASYDYYEEISNVQTLVNARTIESTVQNAVVFDNIFPDPETFTTSWTSSDLTVTANTSGTNAPDATVTATSLVPTAQNGYHTINRDYNLTSYTTFDGTGTSFDSESDFFSTGSRLENQQFTFSCFLKANNYDKARFAIILDPGNSPKDVVFDVDLADGSFGSVFADTGATVDAFGVVPLGAGWYRCFLTITFSFGIGTLRNIVYVKNDAGALVYSGDGTSGLYIWGSKLVKGPLDPYTAVSGRTFYADNDFNIKNYILDSLEEFYRDALEQDLTDPSPLSTFIPYTNSTLAPLYTASSWMNVVRRNFNILRQQLLNSSYVTTVENISGVTVPTSTYGTRYVPVPISGELGQGDALYGLSSSAYAEMKQITNNEAKIVKVYQRFRINGEVTGDALQVGENITATGGKTGTIYATYSDENNIYFDVEITGAAFAILDVFTGAENGSTAEIGAIEDRIQVINKIGNFDQGVEFKAFTSGATADCEEIHVAEAAVLSNTGGKLTVDTASLTGDFEVTSVVYPETSSEFLEVSRFAGLDVQVGDRVASAGHTRLLISIVNNQNTFVQGNFVYRVISGVLRDQNNYGIITEVDLDNNYIYVSMVSGDINNGDFVGDYGVGDTPQGFATVSTKVTNVGAGAGLIQDIKTVGVRKRLYLTDVVGSFSSRDTIISGDGYRAAVIIREVLRARVRRFFRGFDGVQTNFKLTTNNGDPYFPDPAGHMLIFVNGILQPPGATNAYTAFSDELAFTEAPEIGSSFTGFYVGKLRQLDDISFDFDSLRQSFNLKRSGTFYSLTLTEGVQSSVIRPENNIIVSLNGVLQEPGVGFEIVGSRIIFSEIPRFGSTFVAFSYVGSEQDVEAAEVVPPVEPGDFLRIEGETEDREVAVIESSNSLITFDYLGSVFGKGAQASAILTSGTIDKVSVTAGGSGYTSRPNVRVDSITGFDAQIKALVGVGGIVVSNAGSGYKNPEIEVETSVPDDWTPPNLADYGEEVIDPEIL